MTRGRGRRRKQLLDHFKEKRGKWKLKEEELDRLLRKTFLEDAVDLLQDEMRNYVDPLSEILIVATLVLLMGGNSKHKSVVNL